MVKANSHIDCARLLRVLGEPKRLAILRLIFQKPYCVQDLERALELPQYEVSRHLGVLRRAGMVEARREAQRTYYQVHPEVQLKADSLEFGCCRVEFSGLVSLEKPPER
jgi:DNA-binding transcriptional ArsR family regulator